MRVPSTGVSGCTPRLCVLTACREHSQVPLACRLRAQLCVLRTRVLWVASGSCVLGMPRAKAACR
eukprot:8238070-Alexandrium_andersonii.AAC.1